MLVAVTATNAYVLKGNTLFSSWFPQQFAPPLPGAPANFHSGSGHSRARRSVGGAGQGLLNGLTDRPDQDRAETPKDVLQDDVQEDSAGLLNAMLTGSLMGRLFGSDPYPSAESMAARYGTPGKSLRATHSLPASRQFPVRYHQRGAARIHLVSANQALTVVDGKIVSEGETWEDQYKDIFLYRSRKKWLKSWSLMISIFPSPA
ncbi:MAG: hypothetical protein R2860_08210 [Desulfobacterales bacterium]